MAPSDRSSPKNGIWLCQTCAKLVDSDLDRYSVTKLQEWRTDAESAAAQALERRLSPPTGSEGVFLEAQRLMPSLLDEMRSDIGGDSTELVREFVPLPTRGVGFNSRKQRFAYYEDEHANLREALDWLEEMGLIIAVTPKSTPVYRWLPEFVAWLRG